ncbi:putative aspartyl protease [Ophiocordyceps camponoti-floridani]|uniref:Putative aspartyl protease n=1 Tax=Ophiocordyceps camponoti-floridani TaxID=2030778 RepID=A0A8H4VGP5_9HYPO|nr:putative aspartyl protease [Ophiocordyceps camponoti-floridani]
MHSQLQLVLALVFAGLLARAAPSKPDMQKRSFIVKRVPVPVLQRRDGTEEMARTLNKYNLPLPRELREALEKRELKKRELAKRGEEDQVAHQRRDGMGGDQNIRLGLAANMPERRSQMAEHLRPRDDMGGDQAIRLGLAVAMNERRSLHPRQDQGEQTAAAGEEQQPAVAEEPQPAAAEEPQPAVSEEPQPAVAEEPQPAVAEEPQPAAAEEPQPAAEQQAGQQQDDQGKKSGVVEAKPESNDAEYLSPVKIGGQELTLDFDTGSSDLWVFNTQLKDQKPQQQGAQGQAAQQKVNQALDKHTLYDPQQSKTFKAVSGLQFKISYGDGSGALGNVGMDMVDVGGIQTMQAVQLPTKVTGSFLKDANNNGLMGLAFSKINTVKPEKQKTFFESAMPSLKEPVFTADLRRNATGSYEFGNIDKSKFQGDMKWTAVNTTQGFWQFPSPQFAVGDGQPQPTTAGAQAIADTGTTLILADSKIVEGYYSKVQGAKMSQEAGGFTVPCNEKIPDLMLAIGDNMARVAGDQINFSPISAGSSECFGGVQAAPGGAMGIYGDIFFKSNFVAFYGGKDNEGPMLGVAQHA